TKEDGDHPAQVKSAPLPWGVRGLRAMPVVAVTLVLSLLVAGWMLLDHVGSVPVSRVVFTGKLEHVDRQEMVAKVQPLLVGAGFMTVDITAIRAVLGEIPWVRSVSVARSWPDQLVISVVARGAIARRGGAGLLGRAGDVFRPQSLRGSSGLRPLLGQHAAAQQAVWHCA